MFQMNTEGHWAKDCPNPQHPHKLGPASGQKGHWKTDCTKNSGNGANCPGPKATFELSFASLLEMAAEDGTLTRLNSKAPVISITTTELSTGLTVAGKLISFLLGTGTM